MHPPSFPSECPPRFDVSARDLSEYTQNLTSFLKHKIQELRMNIRGQPWTFANVVLPLAHIENHIRGNIQWITLFQSVSPDDSLRKVSAQHTVELNKLHLSVFQDTEIFGAVNTVYQASHAGKLDLEEESLRLLDRYYADYEEYGLTLKAEQQDHLKILYAKVIDLRTKFFENLSTNPPSITKDTTELEGLNGQALSSFKNEGPTYSIVLNRPSITRIVTNCSNEETRREIYLASERIYPENVSLFREIVLLRDETARALGYKSFADKEMKRKLIGSPEAALKFLHDLVESLQGSVQSNIETLSKTKGSRIHLWDFDYYHNILLKEKYQVDHNAISEYFSVEYTLRSMLDIFEELFGLKISKITSRNCAEIWHPDVEPFVVYEATDDETQIGYLYFDLYPRAGKYNHAANFNIRPSYIDEDGKRILPATALVCNITQPAHGKPALLMHREVITVFHELGHAIHDLLGKATYALFHGHRVVKDFAEAPSQFLEYYCWNPEALQRLSCHYSYLSRDLKEQYLSNVSDIQPPMRLPEAMLNSLVVSKGVNQGILTARQIAFSLFDLCVYHPVSHEALTEMNLDETFNALFEDTTLLKGPGNYDYGHPYATSSHWIWGQQSNYYSYLYTRMLAADMWHTNFASNPMDKEVGLRYRKLILSKGGNQDEMKSLIEFLGREPSIDAFFLHDLRIEKSQI